MEDTKLYKDHLSGVGCIVSECKYHTDGNHCTAEKITVKSNDASCKTETFCETFKPSCC